MTRSISLSVFAAILLQFFGSCSAYPIIFEAVHTDRTCIDLNIPDGDDAHILVLPIPDDVSNELEDWFVTEFSEMTRPESIHFLKDLAKAPANIEKKKLSLKAHSKITLTLQEDDERQTMKSQTLKYYEPTIMSNISHNSKGWNANRGSFRLCFTARGSADVRIIFDTIKISEYSEKMKKKHVVKKDHLTPLEAVFDACSSVAKSIIDEMHYMEKREIRMKKTTDGTNARIRYFSYISIAILMGVTWLQIQYLKGYFKKKKVL